MRSFCKTWFEGQRSAAVLAVIVGLFLACGPAKALADEELREWADTKGEHKLIARLQAVSKDAVTLQSDDGKLMEIEIEKLGTEDQKYVRTHQANLKKADDNPFKEKNAAEIEKLQAKLEETQRQAERNAQAANDNAEKVRELERKLDDTQRQVREMGQQLTDQLNSVRLRAAAARADALLLEREFSKTDINCLEEQIRGAEGYLAVQDAKLKAGVVIEVDPLEVKASLGMFKGCLAWVKGDLLQCQKEYDDATAARKKIADIARLQYKAGTIDWPTLFCAEATSTEAELFASGVKAKIAARQAKQSK